MLKRYSDYVFHPPSGSNVPGKVDPNPYLNYPPTELRELIQKEGDEEERKKMISALKQWERIYVYPGYPFKSSKAIRVAAKHLQKVAEIPAPAINIPYYQDSETPSGLGEIIDSLYGLYDNDNAKRVDYNRQGERPLRDIDIGDGDFTNPKEPSMGDVVKEKGDGPDPSDMENPDPPTGGDIDGL